MKSTCVTLVLFLSLQMCCSYKKHEARSDRPMDTLFRSLSKRHTDPHAMPSVAGTHTKPADDPHHNINAIIDDDEDEDSIELGTDYDFVLNLDEREDFDRLLSLLSRSGPAKHSDEATVGVSSTFIDRHDELHEDFPRPQNSVFDQIAAERRGKQPAGSHDDLDPKNSEEQQADAEQKRLEELYFKSLEMDEQVREKRRDAAGSSSPSSKVSLVLMILPFISYFKSRI